MNGDVSIFQRYLSAKFQGSKKRFYEIFYCYITVLFQGSKKRFYEIF